MGVDCLGREGGGAPFTDRERSVSKTRLSALSFWYNRKYNKTSNPPASYTKRCKAANKLRVYGARVSG